jgi:hypothetical protein
MKSYLFLLCLCLLVIRADAQPMTKQDSAKKKLDELVDKKLIRPINEIKNKLDLDAFSRAYTTETYVYDIYDEPTKKADYYQCVLKEMKGAFITEKNEFRADLKKGTITMLDEKTKKYISLDKWLKQREESEEKEEKEKKEKEKEQK